jgi:hypothetical protein
MSINMFEKGKLVHGGNAQADRDQTRVLEATVRYTVFTIMTVGSHELPIPARNST